MVPAFPSPPVQILVTLSSKSPCEVVPASLMRRGSPPNIACSCGSVTCLVALSSTPSSPPPSSGLARRARPAHHLRPSPPQPVRLLGTPVAEIVEKRLPRRPGRVAPAARSEATPRGHRGGPLTLAPPRRNRRWRVVPQHPRGGRRRGVSAHIPRGSRGGGVAGWRVVIWGGDCGKRNAAMAGAGLAPRTARGGGAGQEGETAGSHAGAGRSWGAGRAGRGGGAGGGGAGGRQGQAGRGGRGTGTFGIVALEERIGRLTRRRLIFPANRRRPAASRHAEQAQN